MPKVPHSFSQPDARCFVAILIFWLVIGCATGPKATPVNDTGFSPLTDVEVEKIVGGDKSTWWQHYEKNRAFYLALFNVTDQKDTFEKLLRSQLDEYNVAELKKRIQINRARVDGQLRPAIDELLKALGETEPLSIREVVFFYSFNGKEFLFNDKPEFAVNLAYTNLGSENDIKLLAYHEGIHGVHMRRVGIDASKKLFTTGKGVAWREGLAVFVTSKLLPKLLPRQLVALKEDDFEKCKTNIVAYSGDLAEQLASYERTNRNFFSSRPLLPQYIPRCGFYLAWQAIERLEDEEKDIQKLLDLPPADYETLIVDTITEQGKVEPAPRKKYRRRKRAN